MKKIILTFVFLAASTGLCLAQSNEACVDRCFSKSLSKNDSDKSYCEEKCNRIQDPYAKLQLEVQQESLELQKQQLELQKQTLELQKKLLELQKGLSSQAKQDADPAPDVGNE